MKLMEKGFIEAEKITRKFGETFYFASRFLPREKRYATYAIYAICRIGDEAVDNADNNTKSEGLSLIKEDIDSVYNNTLPKNCLLLAFKQSVDKYKIPKEYFDALIDGMYMDLSKTRYENFEELYSYCYKVSSVVGLVMLKIFQEEQETQEHAVNLGIAMQLTNILRDVKEDFLRGRIYLPQEEMRKFAVSESDISSGKINENFKQFLMFQIYRAREYYSKSSPGIKMIRNPRSRLVISVMKNLYRAILDSMERNNYDIFSKRAQVNNIRRATITLNTLLGGAF